MRPVRGHRLDPILAGALLACLLLLVIPVSAEDFVVKIGENKTFTGFNYHFSEFINDPNNILPLPGVNEKYSENTIARVSLDAAPGEAGIARAKTGVNFTWDLGGRSWDQVQNIPITVTLAYSYEISSLYDACGSSNANFVNSLNNNPVRVGDAQGNPGTGTNTVREVYHLTPGQLGDFIGFRVECQAHNAGDCPGGIFTSHAQVSVDSIQIEFPASEEDFVIKIGENKTFTEFNYHFSEFLPDPNNVLPWPPVREKYSDNNMARVSVTASPNQAGTEHAKIGVNYSWDPDGKSWDQVKDIPVRVTLAYSYEIQAHYMDGYGSANANFAHSLMNSPIHIGFETGDQGTLADIVQETFTTTPEQLGECIRFRVDCGAHTVGDSPYEAHSSQAQVVIDYIKIEFLPQAPVAGIGPVPPDKKEGDPVQFIAENCYDPDGEIAAYLWDFGDGHTGTGDQVAHVYGDSGTFTVTLTVTDREGTTGTASTVVLIGNVPPVVEAGPDQTATEEDNVVFPGSFTDAGTGDSHAITWDFGDGATASGSLEPAHTYTAAGTYTVTLTVTDDEGATAIDTLLVTIKSATPIAHPDTCTTTEDGSLEEPAPGVLANDEFRPAFGAVAHLKTGPAHGILVMYEDGSFMYAPRTDFFGTDSFTYTITSGSRVSAPATVTITVTEVNDPPIALFTFSPASPIVGDVVTFTDGSSDRDGTIVSREWDFGDGGSGSGRTATHVYTTPGSWILVLRVTDNEGASGSRSTTITVKTLSMAVEDVIATVDSFPIDRGVASSLTSDLENVKKSIDKGTTDAAKNQLNAAINEIHAQAGKKISREQAAILVSGIQKIIRIL